MDGLVRTWASLGAYVRMMSEMDGTTVFAGFSGRDVALGARQTSCLNRWEGIMGEDFSSTTSGNEVGGICVIVASEIVREEEGRARLRLFRATPDMFLG